MLPIVMVVLDGASCRVGITKSPLEAASTPNLDALARRGSMGRMYTLREGIAPESDAGVFSLLGYDPLETHLSRGVVEALGAGVEFHDGDLALRAGFATVKGDKLVDRRAGRNLSTMEAQELGFKARKILTNHPANEERRRKGMVPANFVLMRDAGTSKPQVQGFQAKWGLDPLMIADLPAELGIGRLLGMDVRELEPGTRPDDRKS